MADDVELFICAPAQLASQNPSFSKRCIFVAVRTIAAFNLASNKAAELTFQSFLSSMVASHASLDLFGFAYMALLSNLRGIGFT